MPKDLERQHLLGKKIKKFNFVQKLGTGSFGTVYKAVNTKNDDIVAIKVISKSQMKQIPKLQKLVASQIAILKQVNNENVIKFVDSFSSGQSVYIATEFCNGGDLQKYCRKNGKIQQNLALVYLKQILNGFKGLHEINTMHRDFKLANVLLHNNVCKIADLGFAKQIKDKGLTATLLGTDETMAPQVHEGKQYGWGADIWSLGVVFYQMLYGRVPYKGVNDWEILKNIKTTKPDYSDVDISEEALDFIQKCLVPNPSNRITWKQIYDHPLITKSEITLTTGLLRSKISFDKNKTYYMKNEDEKRKTMRLTIKQEDQMSNRNDKNTDIFENAGQIKTADHNADKVRKTKEELDAQFAQYQIDIIHQRNNRMFGLTGILPLQKQLSKISINHAPALYQICKRSFLDLRNYRKQIFEKSGSKQFKYWKQFMEETIYTNIKERLFEDQLFCESLTVGYKSQLGQNENMFRKTDNNQFKKIICEYRKRLTPFAKDLNRKIKAKFLRMLKSLKYMEQNQQYDVQEFNRLMDNFNISEVQKQLLRDI